MADAEKPLDDNLLELVGKEQEALAMRLGADRSFVSVDAEKRAAFTGLQNIKTAHEFMRDMVGKVFA